MLTLWILLLTGPWQTPSSPATESLIERWPSGKVKCERRFYLDDDGAHVLHGPYRERHESGKVAVDGHYQHGLKTGEWKYRDEKGALLAQGSYDDDFKVGTWTTWDEYSGEREKYESFFEFHRIENPESKSVWLGSAVKGNKEDEWYLQRKDGSVMLAVRYAGFERDGVATYLYPDGLAETDWYSFVPREPGPEPERFQNLTVLPAPATSAETDARLQVFLNSGPEAHTEHSALLGNPEQALASGVRQLLALDLRSQTDVLDGAKIHTELLSRLCGSELPWVHATTDAAVQQNARLIRKWYGIWELAREGPHLWEWELCAELAEPGGPGSSLLQKPPLPTTAQDQDLGPQFEAANFGPQPRRLLFGGRSDPEERRLAEESNLLLQRALAWLALQQEPDGTWLGKVNGGDEAFEIGINATCLMALLGLSETPLRGRFPAPAARGARWLLRVQDPASGAFHADQPEPIFQHALALQALSDLQFLAPAARTRRAVVQGADYLLHVQLADGSWPRAPGQATADPGTTMTAYFALLITRDVYAEMPSAGIQRAFDWLKANGRSTSPPVAESSHGLGPATPDQLEAYYHFCRVAGGDVSLDNAEMRRLWQWTWDRVPADDAPWDPLFFLYAGHLSHQVLPLSGNKLLTGIRRILLATAESQDEDSVYWSGRGHSAAAGGAIYTTALCMLTLESGFRYPLWLEKR